MWHYVYKFVVFNSYKYPIRIYPINHKSAFYSLFLFFDGNRSCIWDGIK